MKWVLDRVIANDTLWGVFELACMRPLKKLSLIRQHQMFLRLRERLVSERTVLQGPFKGLHYPFFDSAGSALLPKLLGTYESELFPVLNALMDQDFPVVVDVGCAEGYYAVGVALRIRRAQVFAYDISPTARELCRGLAAANGVADRVIVESECTCRELLRHDFSIGGLIISDCEGYEKVLFNDEVASHLSQAHLIIELHDFIERGISDYIATIFSKSHWLRLIHSVDDAQKARQYHSPLVSEHDSMERLVAFFEGRPEIMTWAVLVPKTEEASSLAAESPNSRRGCK